MEMLKMSFTDGDYRDYVKKITKGMMYDRFASEQVFQINKKTWKYKITEPPEEELEKEKKLRDIRGGQ